MPLASEPTPRGTISSASPRTDRQSSGILQSRSGTDAEKALQEFQTAFRLSGEGATLELYQLLGVTYRELNMHEEAVTVWKQALRVERRKEERIALQKQLAISMTDWGTILKQDFEAQGIERPTEIAGSYLELVMEKYTEVCTLLSPVCCSLCLSLFISLVSSVSLRMQQCFPARG